MPSTYNTPDLDWSQVRETVLMLNVATAQIEHAMRDGDDSITKLAELFTGMMGHIQIIGKAVEYLADSPAKTAIASNFQETSQKTHEAIVAFQFYDRLLQRLTHVTNSLADLADLISDPERLYNPYEWYGLQARIKSKYTLFQDRQMFEAVLNGASVAEALEIAFQKELMELDESDEDDDMGNFELF